MNNNAGFFDFGGGGGQPAAMSAAPASNPKNNAEVNDIMAAFDLGAGAGEKSAFDDADGDLGSDIDDEDAPGIGGFGGEN